MNYLQRLIRSPIPHNLCRALYVWRLGRTAGWDQVVWLLNYIGNSHAWFRTVREQVPLDASGEPHPWYTYPAIEYLSQLDFSKDSVFEYGSGYSSIFWARRAHDVWSVEHDANWKDTMARHREPNHKLIFCPEPSQYAACIDQANQAFNVIVIDGICRLDCARAAVKALTPDGLIILDNSDWHPRTCGLLRQSGFIQIDFSGAGPINSYSWTTSLFLAQAFRPKPRGDVMPRHAIGALVQDAESE